MTGMEDIVSRSKQASIQLAAANTGQKNISLALMEKAIREKSSVIIKANQQDLKQAELDNLSVPLLRRLKFDREKIDEVCMGLKSLVEYSDPVGQTIRAIELDKGLNLFKVSCPIGVIGVIFESRPDALVQISSLCLKSGNAVLLKGGHEAAETNKILADIICAAAAEAGIPSGWLGLLETRTDVAEMLKLDEYIDLIIPRGSNEFVKHIMNNTSVPVLGHADGICHVYVDVEADIDMAINITADSKCQYPAVCNAAETLLVHKDIAVKFLPEAAKVLREKGVLLKGCQRTAKIIEVEPVDDKDWETEYLDYILSIKTIASIEEAIEHINHYGSGHTDTIVTRNKSAAQKFLDLVDSADVFWNCSTRFSDGFRYGLGAELGISTNKIHARGPVGLEGLVIYKWRMIGKGHIVSDYTGRSAKKFAHTKLNKKFELK